MSKQRVTKPQEDINTASLLQTISSAELNIEADSQKEFSPVSMAVYIRSLLQNWRQGTVSCKGRADVAYSNKKPWKQKGTGRARAGSARSPLWRGGGVTFGPQPRTRVLKAGTQVKRNVLNSILFDFLNNKKVVSLDWNSEMQKPSTSQAAKLLKQSGLHQEKIVLFLPTNDYMSHASFINIPNVRILFYDQPNAFDLSNGTRWLVLKKDLEHFKNMVSQWI
jgi:large subunit ribosomal protein L4